MKLRPRGSIAFAIALMGIVAFVGAPMVSYQHLPQHVQWAAGCLVQEREAQGAFEADQAKTPRTCTIVDGTSGRSNPLCHDPDCPYLHFFRTNSSAPASSPGLLADVAARACAALEWGGRIERNPGQVPLLSVAPATSPPRLSMS